MTYNQPKGIFHGTGEPDTGKTSWALGAYPLENTAYFYDDVKKFTIEGIDDIESLKAEFGMFIDLRERYPATEYKVLGYYQAINELFNNIPNDKFSSIIFDTWSRIGSTIRYYAKANPYEFREAKAFSSKGDIKGKQEWGEANNVEAEFISKLSRKCKALFLVTHIKEKYIANVASGTFEPDAGKAFGKVCNMRLWFRHNANSGVPITLVLKRISKVNLVDGYIQPINVLPRKITPLPNETSVWQAISRYWENPVGNREPTQDEIPSPFELSILDGILTNDQKEIWQAELREKQRQDKELETFMNNQYNEAKQLVNNLAKSHNGLPAGIIALQILAQVQEQYPDYTIDDISGMIEV